MNLMFVVPYGGLERKPTQHNNQHHIERRREVSLTIGGIISPLTRRAIVCLCNAAKVSSSVDLFAINSTLIRSDRHVVTYYRHIMICCEEV